MTTYSLVVLLCQFWTRLWTRPFFRVCFLLLLLELHTGFIRRQVRCFGTPISKKNFLQFVVTHTVKGFSVINEAELYVFFWNALAFSMIQWILVIWSLVFLPLQKPAETSESWNIWKFSVHILLKPSLKDVEHTVASMYNECNCMIVWTLWLNGKEYSCQCRRHGFTLWVRKIPWKSSVLVCEILWTGAWQATVCGVSRVRHNLATKHQIQKYFISIY